MFALLNLQSLRCGMLEHAQEACKAAGQHWRSAALSGGEYWSDDASDRRGNPFRLLWQWSHWQNSVAPDVPEVRCGSRLLVDACCVCGQCVFSVF